MAHIRFQVVIFGLTFIAATFLASVEEVCNETEIQTCLAVIPDNLKSKFRYTRKELETSCRSVDGVANCINRTSCATLEHFQEGMKLIKPIKDYICGQRKEEFLDNAQCFSSDELHKSVDFCKREAEPQRGKTPCETTNQLISCTVQTVNICCGKKASNLVDESIRFIVPQIQSPISPSDCQLRSDLVVGVLPLCKPKRATGSSNSVQFLHGSQVLAMVVIFLSLLGKDWL